MQQDQTARTPAAHAPPASTPDPLNIGSREIPRDWWLLPTNIVTIVGIPGLIQTQWFAMR